MAANGTDTAVDHPLLPGQSPPLSIITDTDQSGILLITTALGLILAFVSILIRLFIRVGLGARFAKDDFASFFSMVCSLPR